MNYRNALSILTAALLLGFAPTATAATDEETARLAEEKALQAQLEVEYKKAIAVADRERHAAEASIEKAREQLHRVSEQRQEHAKNNTEVRAAQQAEIEKMHKELSHARRQLQETSREIARVNREVSRARSTRHVSSYAFSTSDRPVIGVILGEADDVGVKVLGVSPDGPSERAGIKRGDVIVAVDGRVLASVAESDDAREGLKLVMHDIKADEPLVISVERDELTLDLTVVPEVREPISRQFVTRFATAPASPSAPGGVISVERIVVPEIDTEELSQQIEQIRVEIDERRALMDERIVVPVGGEYEFEFHEFSEMGNDALHDANVWFG